MLIFTPLWLANLMAVLPQRKKNMFFTCFWVPIQIVLFDRLLIGPFMVDVFVKIFASIVSLILIEKIFPNITIHWKAFLRAFFIGYFTYFLLYLFDV